MKTSTNRAFLFVIAIAISAFFISESKVILAAETANYSMVESAGILPTNPFYFVKKIGWNVRRLFTFNPVKRLDLELEIADQNVAEIKKLEDINLDSNRSLEKAATNYEENLERLRLTLEATKTAGDNAEIEQIVIVLRERGLKHQELFSRLKDKHESLRGRLEEVQSRLEDVINEAPKIFN